MLVELTDEYITGPRRLVTSKVVASLPTLRNFAP